MLHADALELGGECLGGAAHVWLVLRQGGDGRNAEERLQLIEKAGTIFTGKNNGGGRHAVHSRMGMRQSASICADEHPGLARRCLA